MQAVVYFVIDILLMVLFIGGTALGEFPLVPGIIFSILTLFGAVYPAIVELVKPKKRLFHIFALILALYMLIISAACLLTMFIADVNLFIPYLTIGMVSGILNTGSAIIYEHDRKNNYIDCI